MCNFVQLITSIIIDLESNTNMYFILNFKYEKSTVDFPIIHTKSQAFIDKLLVNLETLWSIGINKS